MAGRNRMLVTSAALAGALRLPSTAAAHTVLRIAIVSDEGKRLGTCVLVARSGREHGVARALLTAAALVKRPDGTHAHRQTVARPFLAEHIPGLGFPHDTVNR